MDKSNLGKLIVTAVVALAGVLFFVKSAGGSAQHYKMVDELLKDDLSQWSGKELKVHGKVESGSIHEKVVNQQTIRTFILAMNGKRIRVFSSGPKPDTFKDMSEVVATGHLVPAATEAANASQLGVPMESDMTYVVDASELMAKCPSKYDGASANQKLDPNYN
ncbi:MAG TPA: cytochrome c maturation protein CcmE [Kofleriaceae bacterium]|jgi:cytochrome c-type biogenesis protein CcmE